MSNIIYPRSPREVMAGWAYLPRFVDKIRLRQAGKLHADYQENFAKGLDEIWIKAAGVDPEQFMAMVANTVTDGEVCDWVMKHVGKTEAEKEAHRAAVLNHGKQPELMPRLKMRKEQIGLSHRDDIQTFVDFIDADEGRG